MSQCTSDLLPLDDLIRLSESDRYVEDSKFADLVDLEILEHYKEAARKGNVRPYVRFQWSFASLDGFQWDILESLFNPEIAEVFVKGNTGCGKGASAGIACCMYFDLYENAKIVVTRNNAEDAKQVAYGEVVKWWDEMRIKPNGIPQASRIIEKGRSKHHYLKIANPQHKEGFRGVHSENVLFWFDEACHDDQTEVLTDSGWKFFGELNGSEKLLTMNPESRVAEFVKPVSIHMFPRKGKMYQYQVRGIDMCITPNHRLLNVSGKQPKLIPAENVSKNANIPMPRTFKWEGEERKYHTIPSLKGSKKTWNEKQVPMDEWLEFLGWFLSEGSFHTAKKYREQGIYHAIAITQNDIGVRQRLIQLVNSWGYSGKDKLDSNTPQVHVYNRGLAQHLAEHGTSCLVKRVPEYVKELSPRQIRILLDAYLQGDGYYRPPKKENHSGRNIIYTSSKKMADDLQELILRIGCRSTVTKRPLKGVKSHLSTHVATSSRDGYVVSWSRATNAYWRPTKVKKIDYNGMVYCANVPPHHVLLTRRNGCVIWSGNTAGNLEDKFKLARTQAKKILALSNPSTIAGEFRSAFPANDRDTTQTILSTYGKRRCITISGWDCSNVVERRLSKPTGPIGGVEIEGRRFEHGELIPAEYYEHVKPRIPGQTCYDEFTALLNSPDPFDRNVYALGKFPDEDPEKQVILPSYLVRPNELWLKWQRAWNKWRERHNARALKMLERLLPVQAFGLDVAASATGDKTQLAAGGERGCRELHECQFQDTTQTVDWILETTRELYGIDLTRGGIPIAIDWGGGYGNAVGDPLRRKGVKVVQVNLGSAAEIDPKRYGNKRAELYGEFARRVDPLGDFAESSFYLPDDRELAEELVAPQKIPQGQDGQKFILTPKTRSGASENFKGKTIKELLGRSPDKADAVVLLHEAVRHVGMSLSKTLENGFW